MKDSIAIYKVALTKLESPVLQRKFSNTDQRRRAYKDELRKVAASTRQTRVSRIARKALKDVAYLGLDRNEP